MKFLEVSEQNQIVNVTLARPEVRNAFNPGMIQELTETFRSLNLRKDLRGVVLRGQGKVFCAGGDIQWMKESVNFTFEQNKEDAHQLFNMFDTIFNCHLPIIGVAHGAAYGGALGLLACCDYVIAEEKTQMCFSEVKLGLAPAVISAFLLQKCAIGPLTPLMVLGTVFTPQTAKVVGLVHEIADEESLPDRIEVTLRALQDIGPLAARATKRLLHQVPHLNWTELLDETSEVISELRVGAEGQEGLKAFLDKRQPQWKRSP